MMEFLGSQGFNLYVYAPKDDPFHREKWAEPYPADQLANIKELAQVAQAQGVQFCFAISPGLSIRYSSEADFKLLAEKCAAIGELGVHSFALLLDDIPGELKHDEDKAAFPTLAQAQAHLVNALWQALKACDTAAHLIFCPTVYHGNGDSDYVKEIGEKVAGEVDIIWTGPWVFSPALTASDAERITRAYRRKPILWDNIPCNDGGGRLYLGPYLNREPAAAAHLAGVILNPMNEAEASKITLGCAGEYLRAPATYDAMASWERSLALAAPKGRVKDLRTFAEETRAGHMGWDYVSPIQEKTASAVAADPSAVADARQAFDRVAVAARRLMREKEHRLIAELLPWLQGAEADAEAGVAASRALEDVLSHNGLPDTSRPYHSLLRAERLFAAARTHPPRYRLNTAADAAELLLNRCHSILGLDRSAAQGLPTARLTIHGTGAETAPLAVDGWLLTTAEWEPVAEGDALEIDLGSARPLRRVVVVQDELAPMPEAELLVSSDGSNWEAVAHLDKPFGAANLEGNTVRFLRIEVRTGTDAQARILEVMWEEMKAEPQS